MGRAIWRDGEWFVEGDPPNGLRFVSGGVSARDGTPPPECFGLLWDGIGASGAEDCKKNCDFSPVCLELTAKQALPAAQIRVGAGHGLPELAASLEIGEESILAMMVYVRGGRHPLDASSRKKEPPPPEAAPEPKEGKPKVKKPPPNTCSPDPRIAPSVNRAMAGAVRRVLARAKPARGRAGSIRTKARHWGDRTFAARCAREKERSPLIASLEPGTRLQRTYKGRKCPVLVQEQGYQLSDGTVVPTLYMAVCHYVGTIPRQRANGKYKHGANYSAAKFYHLEKLLAQVEEIRAKKRAEAPVKDPLEIPPCPTQSSPRVGFSDPPLLPELATMPDS